MAQLNSVQYSFAKGKETATSYVGGFFRITMTKEKNRSCALDSLA